MLGFFVLYSHTQASLTAFSARAIPYRARFVYSPRSP